MKYILHDTKVNSIICNSDGVELCFEKGVYVLNEQGKASELSGPCRMVISIKFFDRDKMYEHISVTKTKKSKEKYIEYADFLQLVEKYSFEIYIDYYSFFAEAILLTGNCGENAIRFEITEVENVKYIFE